MNGRYLRVSIIFLIIVFQTVFLGMIFRENYNTPASPFVLPVLLIITAGLVATYLKIRLHHHEYLYEDVGVAIWVPVSAVGCYFLSTRMGLGPVIAAGITGTLGSYLPSLYSKPLYLKKVPFAVYCGAFIGMSSPEVAPTFGFIASAGILAGLLLVLSKSLFLGVGGKLGVLAFGGVVTTAVLFYVLKMPL
jgi:hypothetical protein